MKRITYFCIFFTFLFTSFKPARVFAQSNPNSTKSIHGFSEETQQKLQHIIDSFQNNSTIPYVGGMSVAINVDGLAFWRGATGFAARNIDEQNNLLPGGTPFTADTLSHIYSVTKTFTSPLTLELAQQGVFNLDEHIIKYLPLLNTVNPGLDTTVTIRQLLAHESGYSDYTDEINLQIAVASDPTHIWTPYEMVSYVHQIAPPGSVRKYSSTNYVLLGAIIEAATGKPAEVLFRKAFFNRLNLSSMYFSGRESIGNRGKLASPHDSISEFNPIFEATGQPTFPDGYTNISRFPLDGIVSLAFTGGAIVSNVADVSEWGNDLFSGRATGKSILDTMLASISSTPDEDGDYLGYGIFISKHISPTDTFIGHDGNAPGYRSIMFYQPDRKMTLAVLTNYHGADIYAVGSALYAALPNFLCNNKNNVKICFKGKSVCVPRNVAAALIKNGAYLGECSSSDQPVASTTGDLQKSTTLKNQLFISPNPVTGRSLITFRVAETQKVDVSVYDLNGMLRKNIYNGIADKEAEKQVAIYAGELSSGVYVCRLQTVSGIISQKIIVK